YLHIIFYTLLIFIYFCYFIFSILTIHIFSVCFLIAPNYSHITLFPYSTLFRSSCFRLLFLAIIQTFFLISWFSLLLLQLIRKKVRSEERFSRNAETDLVCRLLLEKKKDKRNTT